MAFKVTVALPISIAPDEATLRRAYESIADQQSCDLDILVILNGSPPETESLVGRVISGDKRMRIVRLRESNLAAALNLALREAKHDVVARMDADDESLPGRFKAQLMALESMPDVCALGCAWELMNCDACGDRDDGRIMTVRPPVDARELRWRLMLANCLAHGSMMLRRDILLELGGYDERRSRSQDYELWLRLCRIGAERSRCLVAAIPEVLYRHTLRAGSDGAFCSSDEQADVAAAAMVGCWSGLPGARSNDRIRSALALALRAGGSASHSDARAIVQRALGESPTALGLMAHLWLEWFGPPAGSRQAFDAARRARLREVTAQLLREGVQEIFIWGAGEHTRWVLEHVGPAGLGVQVVGLVDDDAGLQGRIRFGLPVVPPDSLRAGDWVLLSSDSHETQLWESSADARERGVHVVAMYGQSS